MPAGGDDPVPFLKQLATTGSVAASRPVRRFSAGRIARQVCDGTLRSVPS